MFFYSKTGRRFSIREKEHHKFTRARRKESVVEYHTSALMDHVAQSNHTIDPMSESHWKVRGIKEAMQIHKTGSHVTNQDGGLHQLSDVYTCLLTAAPPVGARQQWPWLQFLVEIYLCKIKNLPYPYTQWTLSLLGTYLINNQSTKHASQVNQRSCHYSGMITSTWKITTFISYLNGI